MKTLTKMYKSVYGNPAPIEVMAEIPSYPHHDENSDKIFENTHFLSLKDAWKRHLREHEAGLSIATSNVKYAREELLKMEKQLADAAIYWQAARDAAKEAE